MCFSLTVPDASAETDASSDLDRIGYIYSYTLFLYGLEWPGGRGANGQAPDHTVYQASAALDQAVGA